MSDSSKNASNQAYTITTFFILQRMATSEYYQRDLLSRFCVRTAQAPGWPSPAPPEQNSQTLVSRRIIQLQQLSDFEIVDGGTPGISTIACSPFPNLGSIGLMFYGFIPGPSLPLSWRGYCSRSARSFSRSCTTSKPTPDIVVYTGLRKRRCASHISKPTPYRHL